MKLPCALALACALLPAVAHADVRRQAAGHCEVVAPDPEDPALRWDYWWSGACDAGLGTGPGFLIQFMKGGGFGDVYAARLAGGRMQGEVRVYGPAFLGAEWNLRVGRVEADEGVPEAWRTVDTGLSRFALPVPLQLALDRFATEVGHPQMPRLPVAAEATRCPAFVDDEGRPNSQGRGIDVAAFIRARGGPAQARREALLKALQADTVASLALATAVAGCASKLGSDPD